MVIGMTHKNNKLILSVMDFNNMEANNIDTINLNNNN